MTETPPPEAGREPLVRSPAVVLASIGLLVGIHAATLLLSPASFDALVERWGFIPARVAILGHGVASTAWVLATFITYAFLHANLLHLAVNCFAFLIFGTIVARRTGALRFLVFSLVAAVLAALAHLVTNLGDFTPVIGASGAISGYMGGAARFMFIDPRRPEAASMPVLPLFSRPVVMFTLIVNAVNVIFGVSGVSPDGSGDLTAWQAHVGGFFAGLLLFPLFDQRRFWLA